MVLSAMPVASIPAGHDIFFSPVFIWGLMFGTRAMRAFDEGDQRLITGDGFEGRSIRITNIDSLPPEEPCVKVL